MPPACVNPLRVSLRNDSCQLHSSIVVRLGRLGTRRGPRTPIYWDAWKTNGKETSTDPPEGAGKRQRAISDLMQLATSASPSVSCSTSTPETVPACVIVQ